MMLLKSDPFIIILTSIISWSYSFLEELFRIFFKGEFVIFHVTVHATKYVFWENINRDLKFWAVLAERENCNSIDDNAEFKQKSQL